MRVRIVKHDGFAEVVKPSPKNPEMGSIRVTNADLVINARGFADKRTAFVTGDFEYLKSLNYKFGDLLQGKIVMHQSFTPFFEKQSPKMNPTTNKEILVNGQFVYLQYRFTQNEAEQDVIETSENAEIAVESVPEIAENAPF